VRLVQAARGASLSSGPPIPPDTSSTTAGRGRRLTLLLGTALLVLAVDVVTKVLVVARLEGGAPVELLGGQLLLRVSRNPGAAFSFAQGATLLFTAVAVIVIVVILRVARRLGSTGWALALGLLLGGAAGNLVDRLLRSPGPGRGAVVDFIDFQVWPSFNVADSAIVCGGLLAVLWSFRGIEIDGTREGRDAPGHDR
jgi:signal peptidase II